MKKDIVKKAFEFEWIKSKYIPLIITSIFYFIFYLSVKGMTGDEVDWFYPKAHDGTPLIEWLKFRYNNWSSRIIIEGIMILILRMPFIVWKLLTGICLSVLLWSLYYIFFSKEKTPVIWVFCALIILCNFYSLSSSAGWVATTLNYVYPVSALFLSFVPIKMIENGKKLNKMAYLILIPIILFALNQELFAVIMLIVGIIYLIQSFVQKRKEIYYYFITILAIASIIFALTCPGNSSRFVREVNTWYPSFNELPFIQKPFIGIVTLFDYIIVREPWIFFISSGIIVFLLYFNEREKLLKRLCSLIPFVCGFIAFIITRFPRNIIAELHKKFVVDGRFGGLIQGDTYNSIKQWLLLIFICIILLMFLLNLLFIFKRKNIYLIFLVIFSGIISQMIMSFSPTIYASSIRTATLLFITLAITGTFLFSKYSEEKKIENTLYLSSILVILFLAFISGSIQYMKL